MSPRIKSIWLDYCDAARDSALTNLSPVAVVGEFVWTAFDEGRRQIVQPKVELSQGLGYTQAY